jgi:hypothetical protein
MGKNFKIAAAVGILFVGIAVASTSAWIGGPTRTTYITFNQAVALPNTELAAGTYIFEVANPDTSANVVRVMSPDRMRVHFQGFTNATRRPAGMPADAVVSLGEAARGTAPRITAWYAVGADDGRQFIYSK